MSIRKRTDRKNQWGYIFDAAAVDGKRREIAAWGFATKKAAASAEATRRLEVEREQELRAKGVTAPIPRTLKALLDEFLDQHCERNLAPKTVERYRDSLPYLSPELLAMPVNDVTPLHLTREWNRLHESGGHTRKKQVRGMSPKTVRNIAGVVSAAYKEGLAWGVVERNPVTDSKRPSGAGKRGTSFTSFDQNLIIKGTIHWALPIILELAAATGARRGEVLAMRWQDIAGTGITIGRSLSQTRKALHFKEPKTPAGYRTLTLPESTLKLLADHRQAQTVARLQFGPDYRTDLDLIICNADGEPLKPDSISGTVSNYLKRLKVGGSLHKLRHSHGSHLLAAGVELTAVSERLGHADVSITAKVYAHAVKGRDAEAAKKWEEFQGRVGKDSLPTEKEKTQ